MKNKMSDTHISAQYYQIRLKGHLEARWTAWFNGLEIKLDPNVDKK